MAAAAGQPPSWLPDQVDVCWQAMRSAMMVAVWMAICCTSGSQEPQPGSELACRHTSLQGTVVAPVSVWMSEALIHRLYHSLSVLTTLPVTWTWMESLTETLTPDLSHTLTVLAILAGIWTDTQLGSLAAEQTLSSPVLACECVSAVLAVSVWWSVQARVSKLEVTMSHAWSAATAACL